MKQFVEVVVVVSVLPEHAMTRQDVGDDWFVFRSGYIYRYR